MATTYSVTTSFTADTTAVASEVNQNFTDVLTALNAYDASNLSSGTVPIARISGLTTTQIAAATLVIESEGIGSNDNDTTWPTSATVKDYVDVQIATIVGGSPTGNDSESNTMLKAHAYLAQTAGFVNAYSSTSSSNALRGFVGSTTNPAGVGTQVAVSQTSSQLPSISFFVANGKYFEITLTTQVVTIRWTPLISGGGKPIDQN